MSIREQQYGFMPRESTTHAILALRFLTEVKERGVVFLQILTGR